MTCSTVDEQIHAYLDGELPEPARAAAERHLAGCAACRERLAAFQGLGRLLRRELSAAAGEPPSLWPAIERRLGDIAVDAPARVPARGRAAVGRRAWRAVVPAAAAAAAVIAAVSLFREREPAAPSEAPAQVASVEGGDRSSVVLLAGTPSEPPIILVTETPAIPRLSEGDSSL
ncbi:MAG TPA: zf-HC2 domain-containing protein [Thermodesulfobacteriota bacterium]